MEAMFLSKARDLVVWPGTIELSNNTIEEIRLVLSVDDDNRLEKIIEAFKEAAKYQKHVDNRIKQKKLTVTQFKQKLASIETNLNRIESSIKQLSYHQETRLDVHYCFANEDDMTYHEQKWSQGGSPKFDSGFMLNIFKMKKGLERYQSTLGSGRAIDDTHSEAIRMIGEVFKAEFPELSLKQGARVGGEMVFTKLINLFLKDVIGIAVGSETKIKNAYRDLTHKKQHS